MLLVKENCVFLSALILSFAVASVGNLAGTNFITYPLVLLDATTSVVEASLTTLREALITL